MNVIAILLLPLVATGLVCLPVKGYWAAGVTVASCLSIFILAARVAWLPVRPRRAHPTRLRQRRPSKRDPARSVPRQSSLRADRARETQLMEAHGGHQLEPISRRDARH